MCEVIHANGKRCETPGELRDALGGDVVPYQQHVAAFGFNYCTCWIDIAKTAAMYGMRVERDDDGEWQLLATDS